MSKRQGVPAVEKTIAILQLYVKSSSIYMGVTEIANALNFHKSTVHSILNTLREYDFIIKSRITGEYALGPAISEIANAYDSHKEIASAFRIAVQEIRSVSGEALACSILKREKLNVLSFIPSDRMFVNIFIPDGTVTSPLLSSAGKVLLARFSDEAIEKVYDSQIQPDIADKVVDKSIFMEQIAQIREKGYCICENEFGERIYGIATALMNHEGKQLAALSMAIPFDRYVPSSTPIYIKTLTEIANKIRIGLYVPQTGGK
mgnify:CR=1 FL=1